MLTGPRASVVAPGLAPATPSTDLERATPVRPSEAIRLGMLVAPVAVQGRLFDEGGGACALGAMAIGLGLVSADAAARPRPDDEAVLAAIGRVLPPVLPHPERYRLGPTTQVIASLNDACDWSRERIAAWLAGWGH